ncbi:hypothetical protein IWX47DRAFT_674263 [Phyllosticta citricarpa]
MITSSNATTGATNGGWVVSRTLGSGRGLVARIPQWTPTWHLTITASHPHLCCTASTHTHRLSGTRAKSIKCICAVAVAFLPLWSPLQPIGVSAPVSLQRIFAAAILSCPVLSCPVLPPLSHCIASHRIASHPPAAAAGAFPLSLTRCVTKISHTDLYISSQSCPTCSTLNSHLRLNLGVPKSWRIHFTNPCITASTNFSIHKVTYLTSLHASVDAALTARTACTSSSLCVAACTSTTLLATRPTREQVVVYFYPETSVRDTVSLPRTTIHPLRIHAAPIRPSMPLSPFSLYPTLAVHF